ncbi:MAG: lipoate--protein ligase family protein [Chloroflexota bacterium]|nr:MAG: lipoate--protein ligase family protein [Chloroflexota bacterium]
MTIRLLNLGQVSYLHSQTTYHAVAHAMSDSSPDTITLMTPDRPYVCVGYHQDAARDVDLDYCQSRSLPVLRRAIGGGTVLLDRHQLFFHCIFHPRRAPRRVADLYRLVLGAPIRTFEQLGLRAELVLPNDIQVAGRKIVGSGGGMVGNAAVVGGSLIFAFDRQTMARLANCPSEEFRVHVSSCLKEHMSCLGDELAAPPSRADVTASLVESFASQFGAQLVPGELRTDELAERARLDEEFVSSDWLFDVHRPSEGVHSVKVAAHVYVCQGHVSLPEGSADVIVSTRSGTIRDVSIIYRQTEGAIDGELESGRDVVDVVDAYASQPGRPALSRDSGVESLTALLRGCPLEEQYLRPLVQQWADGLSAHESADAILSCLMEIRAHLEGL